MEFQIYDFIIVGGGIAGTTLAFRLHGHSPNHSVCLIEAGPDVSGRPLVTDIKNAGRLVGSELYWIYFTVPQQHLNDGSCPSIAGKVPGGGSLISASETPHYIQILGALMAKRRESRWMDSWRCQRLCLVGPPG